MNTPIAFSCDFLCPRNRGRINLLAEIELRSREEPSFEQFRIFSASPTDDDAAVLSRCAKHALGLAAMHDVAPRRPDLFALASAALIVTDKLVALPDLKKYETALERLQLLRREHGKSKPFLIDLENTLDGDLQRDEKIFRSVRSPSLDALLEVSATWAAHVAALASAENQLVVTLRRWHADEMIPGRRGPKVDATLRPVLRQLSEGGIGAKDRLRLVDDGGPEIGRDERYKHQMQECETAPYGAALATCTVTTVQRGEFDGPISPPSANR
jgi:hypothetical protein